MNNNPLKHSELAQRIADEVTRLTTCEHYRLTLNEQRQPGITDSKVGGLPYWPSTRDYPVDNEGNKMMMILQINCEQAQLQAPLPQQGMLQWFISVNTDLMYGCRGNQSHNGETFAVIHHDTIDQNVTAVQLQAMQVPTHATVQDMVTPVKREVAIDVTLESTAMGVTDGGFKDVFNQVMLDLTGEDCSAEDWFTVLDNSDAVYLERTLGMQAPAHQMLGYAVFTQDDPRQDMASHDTLLIQLASQFSTIDRKELVMWGDMGAGFLFIDNGALVARDWSHVLYTWDCG